MLCCQELKDMKLKPGVDRYHETDIPGFQLCKVGYFKEGNNWDK